MAVEPTTGAETARLSDARERYVAAGVATTRTLRGARARRDDRRRRRARVHRLRRRHRRAERRPHARGGRRGDPRAGRALPAPVLLDRACTSRTSRSAGASASCIRAPFATKALLQNSGAEAVENAVKIAPLRDRPRRHRLLRPGVPRPHAADDDADVEGDAVQEGLRPVRARGLPRRGAVARTAGSAPTEALASVRKLFKSQVDPQSVAALIYEPVQGEGGFLPATPGFLEGRSRRSAASTASSTSTTRCSPAWAAPARRSRSTTSTASSPT